MAICSDCKGLGWRLRELENGGSVNPGDDTFEKLQTDPGFQDIISVDIEPWTVMRLEITLVAKDVNNEAKATFKRMGLFYREDAEVKHQGTFWHTLDTTKSHGTMDVGYTLTSNSVIIRTKNAGSVTTFWKGTSKKLVI